MCPFFLFLFILQNQITFSLCACNTFFMVALSSFAVGSASSCDKVVNWVFRASLMRLSGGGSFGTPFFWICYEKLVKKLERNKKKYSRVSFRKCECFFLFSSCLFFPPHVHA